MRHFVDAYAGHVLITGILSFVVDNSETEFDERIDDVRQVRNIDDDDYYDEDCDHSAIYYTAAAAATARTVCNACAQMKALAPQKKVFVPEVFSSTNGYASNAQFNK